MSQQIGVPMGDPEIERFLKDRGLGVLGLTDGATAYTIPMAFAYDDGEDRCIFRFVMAEESKKRAFLAETATASLTVFEWNGIDDWKSVVVTGALAPIPDEEIASAAALFSEVGEEAALEVFNAPIAEYETAWYELRPDEITGRGRFG